MYESFSDAAFNISAIGNISKPVKTPAGWHVIKLLDKKELPSYKDMEASLKSRVEKDSRSQKSRDVLIKRCKEYYSFKESRRHLDIFYNMSSEYFLKAKTTSDILKTKGRNMFSLIFNNDATFFSQNDFADFLINFKNSFRKNKNSEIIINELYRMFVEQSIINFENQNLEAKYDEFALLMDEYHDGILLFELMNEKVWSKAVKDTSGLKDFYSKILANNNSEKYFYPNRILSKSYLCTSDNKRKVAKAISKGYSNETLLKKFNKKSVLNLTIKDSVYYSQATDNRVYNHLYDAWNKSPANHPDSFKLLCYMSDLDESSTELIEIIDFIPQFSKPIKEVKGLVISEYQNFLEEEWISSLRKKYEIIVNEDVLNLLKKNRLDDLINFSEIDETPIFKGSFSQAYKMAVKKLGSSKDKYFKWRGNLYTTE